MNDSVAQWDKYKSALRDFDSVLEHGKAVSAALVGLTPPERYLSYGEQIFVKLLGHCITLRRISPDPSRRTPTELWDLASLSAVARCAIESHDAFFYIAGDQVESNERAFRLRLWELHDKTRRHKMLEAIGSRDPRTEEIRSEAQELHRLVVEDSYFQSLPIGVRKRIMDDDPPPYHSSQRERCMAAGINFDYYNAVTMQLSQYVHTLPFSIHQLFNFRAGSADALALMSLPGQYTLPFLSKAIQGVRELFPQSTPDPPSRVAKKMALATLLAAKGVKSAC